ncbi:MAG: RNA polymerase factor sigma-54 [Acidobacteria bacterium]|nr:MAG: RNA polymerase factor sigma-54 [Acidobacteriota bacterium]
MQQKLTLQIKLQQKLILTPSLQQAIKLLPMSSLELADMLQQEITENPLLEEEIEQQRTEATAESANDANDANDAANEAPGEGAREAQAPDAKADGEPEPDAKNNDSLNEIDYESFFSDYLDDGYRPPTSYEVPDLPPIENTLSTTNSLADHLDWQLRMAPVEPKTVEIGEAIIGNIDGHGYLQASMEELCEMGPYEQQDVEDALVIVQAFDPVGVGARDLKECLLIQLRRLELTGTPVATMVTEHLDHMQNHRFNEIAKAMHLPLEDVIHNCEIIRRLDPQPGSKFSNEKSFYVTPDVYVLKVDGKYEIVLNEDRLPQLRISPIYRRMLENKSEENHSTREYVKEKLRSALWLIKSVDQRQKTIYKVANSIVHQQQDFLDNGVEHLRPMVLRDVAIDIGMHESTVSRVVANKYIHTVQGVFDMKYFFHSGIASIGGDNVSSVTIKRRIKKIVEEENPKKPLSDSKIVRILEDEGLILARRTIAKYREELRIPPSNQRKNLYCSPFAS